jgi:hypothetical protein
LKDLKDIAMNTLPEDNWDDANEPPQSDQSNNVQGLEEQEQQNSQNLAQRIEEENQPDAAYADPNELTEQPSRGEEDLSGFLGRTMDDARSEQPIGSDKPLTKNLLGDNPPGSEQAVFDAGNPGDASAEQFKYNSENLVEGFRENLDKTQQQVNLDKRLKDKSDQNL